MSDIFDEETKELIKLATVNFDKFYEETEKFNKARKEILEITRNQYGYERFKEVVS